MLKYKPIDEDVRIGTLENIRKFIGLNYKMKAEDPVEEMLRIDMVINNYFTDLFRGYGLMVLVKEFNRILFHADEIRRIGHLYEAYVIASLNGKTSAGEDDFIKWSVNAKKVGFRSVTVEKIYLAYDKLREREGFTHLKPRMNKAPSKVTIMDRMEKLLQSPKFKGWQNGPVNLDQLIQALNETANPGIEYKGTTVDFNTVRDTLLEMRARAKHEKGKNLWPRYQQFRVDKKQIFKR